VSRTGFFALTGVLTLMTQFWTLLARRGKPGASHRMRRVTVRKIPRIRGIWLAGLVALSLLTFGIVPHSAAAGHAASPGAPVAQTAAHVDPVVLTRAPTSPVAVLKTAVPYADLALGGAGFGLVAWLLVARPVRRPALPRLLHASRLSRAPPLAA
jgi:hypothetical protein